MEGKKHTKVSWLETVKGALANYPLTFYFGIVFFAISAIFIVLSIRFDFHFTFTDFYNWLNAHAPLLLASGALILSLVLTTSGLAYKKVARMSKQDYAIWLQMRSTRTLFPFFTPLHDWLRMRVSIYRWWSTRTYASPIHTVLLVLVMVLAFRSVDNNVFVSAQSCTYGPAGMLPGSVIRAYAAGNAGGNSCDYFVVTGTPTTAGTPGTVVVTEYTEANVVNTDYRGTVHFTSTDGQAVLPVDYTYTGVDAGTHTFTNGVTLKTAGAQTLTATDTPLTGITGNQAVTVSPGSTTQLVMSNLPTTAISGTALTPIVTAKDAYGNITTAYTGTIHFTSTDGSATLPSNYTFVGGDAGVHTFTGGVTLVTVASKTVTVTDIGNGSLTSTSTINVTSTQIVGNGSITFTTCSDVAGNTAWTNPGNATNTDAALTTNVFTAGTNIAYDTSASAAAISTTANGSITIGSGSNRILVVAVQSYNSVTGVTLGASSLTLLSSITTSTPHSYMYYLLSPSTGAGTITVSAGSTAPMTFTATSWANVSQSTPFGTAATAQGASGQPTVGVTSASGEVVVDGAGQNATGTLTSSQTGRVGVVGTTLYAASASAAGASSVTMAYTGASAAWSIVAAPMKPSSPASIADYIKCTQLVNPIPSTATVTGIAIDVLRKSSVSSTISDTNFYLVKGGTIQTGWTDKASGTNWPTTLTTASYGGSSDLWGGTLTAADINATDFGVALQPQSAGAATASIDSITGTIYYTTPAASAISVGLVDGFNTIDTSLWNQQNGTNTAAILSNRLKVQNGSATSATAGLNSRSMISGDFDIRVDFDNSSEPTPASGTGEDAQLHFSGGTINYNFSHRKQSNGTYLYYLNSSYSGGTTVGTLSTSQSSGTIRAVRSGTTLTMYYLNGTTWTSVTSTSGAGVDTAALTPSIWQSNAGATGQAGLAYFDNFIVASGTVNSQTAGTAFTLAAMAVDTNGIINTTYTGTAQFSSTDSQAVLPSNYTFVSGDAGFHQFTTGATLKTSGSKTITATDTVTGSINGVATYNVNPATTSKLSVVATGTATVAFDAASHGTGSGTSITVSHVVGSGVSRLLTVGVVLSTSSNTVTGVTYNGTAMTLVPGSVSTGTLSGTNRTTALYYLVAPTIGTHNIVVSASSGLVLAGGSSWTGVNQTSPLGTAAIANASNGTSVSVAVSSSNTQLVVDVGASAAAGSTSFATTQTSRWTDSTNNGGSASAVGATSVTMGYTDASAAPMSISAVPLLPDVTTTLSSITAGVTFNSIVTSRDAYNNTTTSYTGTIHFTSTDAQAVLPNNYTFVGGDAGTHTFTGTLTLKTAGDQTVTATDINTGSITGTSGTVTVFASAASTYAFSSTPTTATAGTPFSTTLTAVDAYGNTAANYLGRAHFTSTDAQAVLPSDYTFVNGDLGAHTFTNGINLKTVGTQTITATDTVTNTITATSANITVSPAAASSLVTSGAPTSVTAGTAFSETITAKDAYNNTATGYTGTIHFTSSDSLAVLPGNYTFIGGDSGTHTFTNAFTLKTSGSKTVVATDIGNGSLTTTATITVNAGPVSQLVFSSIPASTTAGTAFSGTLSAEDSNNNVVSSYTGTVRFTSSDTQAVLPSNYTFVGGDAGTHAFTSGFTLKTSGSQTITATDMSDGSITGATSVTVATGSATQLVFTTPVTATAGSPISGTVTAKDAYSNTITSYTGTVHFTSSDTQAVLPSNYTFVGGDAGSHVFTSGITLKTSGSQTITVTDIGNGSLTATATITVSSAALNSLALTGPGTATAGSAFTATVTAEDAYGNTITSYTGTVHFTSSDTQAVLPSNYTFVGGDAGSHVFTNGITLKTVGTKTVSVSDDTYSASISVVVNTSTATQFVFSSLPTSVTAGAAFGGVLTATDAFGNTATGYTGTVHFTSSDTQAVLPSNYTFVGGDAGAHTFTSSFTLKTVGSKTLVATDTVTASITASATITVVPGSASSITISSVPSSVTAGSSFTASVTAADAFGNTATSYIGSVHFTSNDTLATLPANYTFTTGDNGTHTFSNSFVLRTASSKTVTVTDLVNGSLTSTVTITVSAAAASSLSITSVPTTSVAGNPFSIGVSLQDSFGNTATGYTGTVHFTSSDAQAVLPSNYTFVGGDAGAHTFTSSVTLKTAGAKVITVADISAGSLTDSATVNVTSAVASSLAFSSIPTTVNANAVFSAVLVATDAFGNTATGYTGTVHFTSSDTQAVLPSNYTFVGGDAGSHVFSNSFTFKTVNTQSLVVTDISNGSLTVTAFISVIAGTPERIVFTSTPATATAGSPINTTVNIEDQNNNIVSSYTGTIHFSSTDVQVVLPSDYTFVGADAGTHTFTNGVTFKTAGQQTLVATDTGVGSLTSTMIISVAAAEKMQLVMTAPTTTVAGAALSVTTEVKDAYNNPITDYAGTVHFTSTDGQAALPSNYTYVSNDAGVHTFSGGVTLKTVGSQTLTVAETGLGALSTNAVITVTPSYATQFIFSDVPSSVVAGTAFSATLTAKDAYGNVATSYTGPAAFSSTDTQAVLPGTYTFVGADNGVHTFTNSVILKTAGNAVGISADGISTIPATNQPYNFSGQTTVTVLPSTASTYLLTAVPSTIAAGTAFSPVVSVVDAYGNAVPGFVGTVHFSSSDSRAVLPANYTFVANDSGSHTFSSGVTLKTSGSKNITVQSVSSDSVSPTTKTVIVTPGAVSELIISNQPTTTTAGAVFSAIVTAEDAYQNTVTAYTNAVGFTSTDAAGVLPNNYGFTGSDSGTHAFTNAFALKTVGSKTITVTDLSNAGLTDSVTIAVTAGSATNLTISSVPISTNAGSAFSATITATDAYQNTATNYAGIVHFSSTDTQATLPTNYTFVSGDLGVHVFANGLALLTEGSQTVSIVDTNNVALTDSVGIVVNPGAANNYLLTAPLNASVNAPFTMVLEVKDAYDNRVTNYAGITHFTSSDTNAILPSNYTFTNGDNGLHSFTNGFSFARSGSQTITATDTVTNTLTATATLQVSSGVATQLVMTNVATTTAAGTKISPVITVRDSGGNIVTTYTGTVRFGSNDNTANLPANYQFTSQDSGSHTFTNGVIFTLVGDKSLVADDGSLSATQSVTVTPGPAAQLVFGSVPAISIANTYFSPSLTVKDAYGNLVTNYTGSAHFTSSDANAVLPITYTYTSTDAGVHIFTGQFSLRTVGQQTLTAVATGPSLLTVTANVNVVAGDASQLVISQTPSTVTAGTIFGAVITVHDSAGSVATNYTGTVRFSSNDLQASLPSDYTFTARDAGVHTFTNAFTLKTAGIRTLTAADTSNPFLTNTAQVIVTAAPVGHLVAVAPRSVTNGATFTVTIAAEDIFGNIIVNYGKTIGFTSTDTQAVLPASYAYKALDQGSHTFTKGFALNTLGVQGITAAEVGGGLSVSFNIDSTTSKILLVPPFVKITTPTNGAVVGGTFTIAATSQSTVGIKNVLLLVDGSIVADIAGQSRGNLFTGGASYQTTVDSSKLSNGTHLITAIATDNRNQTNNDQVRITVSNKATNPTQPENPTGPQGSSPFQKAASAASVVSSAVTFVSFAPTASIVTTAISTGALQGLSIFSVPFASYGRRRRKRWGLVRNALTGLPVSGVFVEIWDTTRPQLLGKTLTDNSGQFAFIVDKPGQFHLRVDNPLYKTYDSGIITVTDQKAEIVQRQILLEPIEKIMQARLQKALRLIRVTEYLAILHWPLLIAGSALSIFVIYNHFTVWNLVVVIVYGLMWLSKIFQAQYQRPFGVVVDSATERPQELSIVQLTTQNADDSQMVRSTITDSRGRFLFVVKPDKYNLVAAKAGFKPSEQEIKGDNINVDVRLKWDEKDDTF